jgi:hypothetical protein
MSIACAMVSAVDLVVFWCGPKSAITALTPKPLWSPFMRIPDAMRRPLRGDKRFYWGAAPSDWSGGRMP